MDLKNYYQRIRELEASLPGESVVVVSRATPDGGRAGCFTEVPRAVAARMVADGIADIAGEANAARFAAETLTRHAEEERRRAAAHIQVNLITEEQARALSGPSRLPPFGANAAAGPAPRAKRERS